MSDICWPPVLKLLLSSRITNSMSRGQFCRSLRSTSQPIVVILFFQTCVSTAKRFDWQSILVKVKYLLSSEYNILELIRKLPVMYNLGGICSAGHLTWAREERVYYHHWIFVLTVTIKALFWFHGIQYITFGCLSPTWRMTKMTRHQVLTKVLNVTESQQCTWTCPFDVTHVHVTSGLAAGYLSEEVSTVCHIQCHMLGAVLNNIDSRTQTQQLGFQLTSSLLSSAGGYMVTSSPPTPHPPSLPPPTVHCHCILKKQYFIWLTTSPVDSTKGYFVSPITM